MAKAKNYTEEQVARLAEVYGAATTDAERADAVASLSEELGKNLASIRAKLSHMGVYVRPTRTTKDGRKVITKEKLAEDIATLLNLPGETGLEKANKAALREVFRFVWTHTASEKMETSE